MNIVKTVKKLGNKVKKGYDKTNINPFKIPDKIEHIIRFDIKGSYGDAFKWFASIPPKEVEKYTHAVLNNAKIVESVLKKRFKWVSYFT